MALLKFRLTGGIKRKAPEPELSETSTNKRQRRDIAKLIIKPLPTKAKVVRSALPSATSSSRVRQRPQKPPARAPPGAKRPAPEEVIVISDDDDDDEVAYGACERLRRRRGPQECRSIKPCDSHQDDIVVHSVETDLGSIPVGVEHYIQELAKKDSYEHIGTDFAQYRGKGIDASKLAHLNEHRHPDTSLKTKQKSTKQPTLDTLPDARSKNYNPVYEGRTYNPLIPLAIVRIAQKNMPSFNFDSALDHLPNMDSCDRFPELPGNGVFLDTLEYKGKSSDDCTDGDFPIYITFIPSYYADGRHCIGFRYGIEPSSSSSSIVKSLFYTPCTMPDLLAYGLVRKTSTSTYKGSDPARRFKWAWLEIGATTGFWMCKVARSRFWNEAWDEVDDEYRARLRVMMGHEEEGEYGEEGYGMQGRVEEGWGVV